MRKLGKIFLRWLVWVLPVHLFDGCLNKDPYLKIDEEFTLSAICGGCPLTLSYRPSKDQAAPNSSNHSIVLDDVNAEGRFDWKPWHLQDISDLQLSTVALIGRSGEAGYFIADRGNRNYQSYRTMLERDQALQEIYQLDPQKDFQPPTEWMWLRSRWLWPWVEIYYLVCLVVISWKHLVEGWRAKRSHHFSTAP